MARVVVAMSGGVDSSVAALLLRDQGHDLIGMSMNVWDYERSCQDSAEGKSCCSPQDVEDARRVCDSLDIPFFALNFREAFRTEVVAPFIDDYLAARTPNPCVLCNDKLKFDLLWRRALAVGADYIATGHYSQLSPPDDAAPRRLFRAIDRSKDQTYFLFGLKAPALEHCLFPLGGLRKSEVREIAAGRGLRTAAKAESQDICFVREGSYADLVAQDPRAAGLGRGPIVDLTGRVLGRHEGYYRYTIGQRRGLGVGFGEKMFVVGLDAARNEVRVGPESALLANALHITRTSFVGREELSVPRPILCQVRSRQGAQKATLLSVDDKPLRPGDAARVVFEEPQRALTEGQAAVFFTEDDQECLGGGWIDEVRVADSH